MLGICRPDARPPLTVTWCGRSLLAARCCLALVLIHSEQCRRNMLSEKDLSPTIHFTSKNQLKRSQLSKNHLTPSHFISLHLARCTDAVHPQNAHPPKKCVIIHSSLFFLPPFRLQPTDGVELLSLLTLPLALAPRALARPPGASTSCVAALSPPSVSLSLSVEAHGRGRASSHTLCRLPVLCRSSVGVRPDQALLPREAIKCEPR
jgi:hypothetical protein